MVSRGLRGRYTCSSHTAPTTSKTEKNTFPEQVFAAGIAWAAESVSSRKDLLRRGGVLMLVSSAALPGCLQELSGFRPPFHMFSCPVLTRMWGLVFETELLSRKHLFIYLFVRSFILEVAYKRHNLAKGGREFSSSPEKSVTGLGFFSSNPKELISSFHINKPYVEPR